MATATAIPKRGPEFPRLMALYLVSVALLVFYGEQV